MTTASDVRRILEDPLAEGRRWTLQGFGMLRLYMAPDEIERLHIWDTGLQVEDVSTVHDHPWDLDSRIISGTLQNQRYEVVNPAMKLNLEMARWKAVTIRTGEGGHPLGEPQEWVLERQALETYEPGDAYHQDAPEIHESIPQPGTVTIVRRTFSRERDIATSCYLGDTWVSAEPRPATPDEVRHFTDLALLRWNG